MRKLSQRPSVRPPRRWSFPTPAQSRLDNGMQVLTFQRDGQHVASIGLVLDVPLTLERPEQEGVATLVQRCLAEGTKRHPDTEYAVAVEGRGASVAGFVGHATTRMFMDVPVDRLDDGLALLAEAVIEPELTPEAVERQRLIRLAEIDQEFANSARRAGIAFRGACVPRRFRSARPTGGEASCVAAITAADVAEFHARHYRPEGTTLVISGDLDGDALASARAAFGAWAGALDAGLRPELPQAKKPRFLLIDRPGAVQADVRLGGFGIDRHDPGYADLSVACHALGGSFLSRLNRDLREKKGFTYGVHLSNHSMRSGGLLSMQGSFRTEVVVKALNRARKILDVTNAPLTQREVDDAVSFTRGITPLRFSTASGITDGVAALVSVGLTTDYVDAFMESLGAVTPQSATQAIQTLLPPDGLTLVVVGDADALAGPLTKAGWPVKVAS